MALFQKLSEKVNANAPTNELPNITIELLLSTSVKREIKFFNMMVAHQNKNKMVNALEKTEVILTINAIC